MDNAVLVEVPLDLISDINRALREAKENSVELLSIHDNSFGRTTSKNKSAAMFYEKQITNLDVLILNTND